MQEITKELTEIADALGAAIKDAQKFDKGNDAAGTRVRKAAQEARARLFGLRNKVTEVREQRSRNQAQPAE